MGGKRGVQEQLQRTHGQNQGGWNQGSEVGMAGVAREWWGVSVQRTMVHLHNGIVYSRKKEGAPTLWDSMNGTTEHYAK